MPWPPIKTLDVNMTELMLERPAAYDDEEGMKIANFKEYQYALLDKLADDIKAETINADFISPVPSRHRPCRNKGRGLISAPFDLQHTSLLVGSATNLAAEP
jgi:hypothetical protein